MKNIPAPTSQTTHSIPATPQVLLSDIDIALLFIPVRFSSPDKTKAFEKRKKYIVFQLLLTTFKQALLAKVQK